MKGNQIAISSLVAGSVISVNYTDTDLVRQGDVLVTLDDTDARINFNKAANNLANTVRKIKQMYIADDQYNANVQEAKIAYQQALADYQRRSRLQGAAAISRENMQHAKDAVDSSKAALDVAVQAYRGNRVLIQNTALEKQPEVLMAAESMREAWVALQRTKVRSPVTGYLAQRNVQVGETIGSGQALMSIIPAEQVWINANFKETQLSGVKIGQKVSIVTDFYGSDVVFNGRVDGINMGTGSAFRYCLRRMRPVTGSKWFNACQYALRWMLSRSRPTRCASACPPPCGCMKPIRRARHWQRRSEKPRLTQATHWLSIPPLLITKSSISSKPTRCDL